MIESSTDSTSLARFYQAKFVVASALTGSEFLSKLSYLAEAWLPARSIIQKAFAERHSHHSSGKILVFETFAPWKEHLFEVEKEEGVADADKPVCSRVFPFLSAPIELTSSVSSSFLALRSLPRGVWTSLEDPGRPRVRRELREQEGSP